MNTKCGLCKIPNEDIIHLIAGWPMMSVYYDDDDDDELFLWYVWLMKGV